VSKFNYPDHPISKSADSDQNRDINALFSSFRVDQPGYRTFARHRAPKPSETAERVQAETQEQTANRTAIYSPIGGSGKTMLAASLAAVLWQRGKRVLLVDASPWPALAFHYGASEPGAGMRSFFAPGKDLPVRILARDIHEAATPNLDVLLASTPADSVLFDLSGISSVELPGYLQQISTLIVPLVPDLSAARYADAMRNLLSRLPNPPQRVLYVVNRMEDTALAKDACAHLSQLLGGNLLANPIYYQDEVREALAEGIVLPLYAPDAQAIPVCNEIVQWLEAPKPTAPSRTQQRWSER
jgi:MinD-like ATPase involved in chromosome partitioning or flagellar assembly